MKLTNNKIDLSGKPVKKGLKYSMNFYWQYINCLHQGKVLAKLCESETKIATAVLLTDS